MSYDFTTRLAACPHEITGERYIIDTVDFRTLHLAYQPSLNMRAPINGRDAVRVFISGVQVQSNDPTYGYSIPADENRINTPDRFYKIMFNRAVRWFVPLIEVSYITLQPYCLRCSSQGALNDIVVSPLGNLQRVWDTNKLVQKVLKFVLTSTCPFYPQLTCKVRDYIGRKFTVTEEDISFQVQNALLSVKQVQSAQRTVQSLSPLEMLKDLTGISVTTPDPTAAVVECSVTSYGSQATPSSITFSVSSSRQLVGN